MDNTEICKIIEHCAREAGGVRALARKWRISPAYVSDMIHGRRAPGPRVLARLGYVKSVERTVTYEKDELRAAVSARWWLRTKASPKRLQKFREYNNAQTKEWYARMKASPERYAAHLMRGRARLKTKRAVEAGKMIRPNTCSRCDKPCKPEAHHHDYAKPYEVSWLCRQCHHRERFPRKPNPKANVRNYRVKPIL